MAIRKRKPADAYSPPPPRRSSGPTQRNRTSAQGWAAGHARSRGASVSEAGWIAGHLPRAGYRQGSGPSMGRAQKPAPKVNQFFNLKGRSGAPSGKLKSLVQRKRPKVRTAFSRR